ncbi:MAG TPA: Rieske 2Fe-2S domain-containing protein [Stellaceae bacterium]|nr:Rieske 2Fe-2S domain-containing protein [Stellaceae bacterium]
MTSASDNERMTRIGPGTPAGALMRRYWQPVALVEELAGRRPVKAVRVLGEDLVLFRDAVGKLGLLARHCPHRGADLAYGRLEDGGLRCAFHGWLFDANGRCLETPAEPVESELARRVRHRSYPVVEKSGIVWAYLGEGEPPAFQAFDCFTAPDTHVFAFKGYMACNWLQALEVGIDPAHASYLHRFFEDEEPGAAYGQQFRAASSGTDIPMTRLLREHGRPKIEVERTDYGFRLIALRPLEGARTHVRVTNLVFPHGFVIPLSPEMTISQWHMPIDDRSCYWYAIFTSFAAPVDKATMRQERLKLYTLPDYKPRLNAANEWGFNADEQATATFTGMGFDINVHDQWAVESQGEVHDRTRETLGFSDRGIVLYRRMLLDAIADAERGKDPVMALTREKAAAMRGPSTIDTICPSASWQLHWREAETQKRKSATWDAGVEA